MKYQTTQDLLNKDTLTFQEILNIKKRLNGYAKSKEKAGADNYEFKDEYKITPEHTAKGLEYLQRVAFKPSKLPIQLKDFEAHGISHEAVRSNSPLGYRELIILLQFHHFTFTGFYNASNQYQESMGLHVYYPLWKCYDLDGDSFEYYLEGGEMTIIG